MCNNSDTYSWPQFYKAVADKWIPIIISGVFVAMINHYYWQERTISERDNKLYQIKIDTIINANKNITSLFLAINNYASHRDEQGNGKDSTENKFNTDVDTALNQVSKSLTKLRLIFDKEISGKISIYITSQDKHTNVDKVKHVVHASEVYKNWQIVKLALYEEMQSLNK